MNDRKRLHVLTLDELKQKLTELTKQSAQMKLQKAAHKLSNVRMVTLLSDDIARIQTIIRQKEMEEQV